MQERAEAAWLNLGVDAAARWLPDDLRPGIGLRPGGERPDLEDAVVRLYRALFETVAAHARQGFNVVVDVGLHVLFVGVHCAPDVIWRRRAETWGQARETADEALLDAVARWPVAVHAFR